MYVCTKCKYTTTRRDNYQKHINTKKHILLQQEETIILLEEQNAYLHEQNVLLNKIHDEKTDVDSHFCCRKCCEVYKTKKQLKCHETNCYLFLVKKELLENMI